MLIIKTKKDLAEYVRGCEEVDATRADYGDGFDEVEEELVKLLAVGDGSPDFGEDWEEWLAVNVEILLEEALSIVA